MQKGLSTGHGCTQDVTARDQVCLGLGVTGTVICHGGAHLLLRVGWSQMALGFLPVRSELGTHVAAQPTLDGTAHKCRQGCTSLENVSLNDSVL